MTSSEIASAVERGITSQTELITSLSLAVIGGLLVFFVQIRIHNASHPGNLIQIRRFAMFWLALAGAGVAIALGYVIAGMLIQMAPQLFSHSFDLSKAFSDQKFDPAPTGLLQAVSVAQFLVFLFSIVFGIIFVFSNRKQKII